MREQIRHDIDGRLELVTASMLLRATRGNADRRNKNPRWTTPAGYSRQFRTAATRLSVEAYGRT
jgi:hypothetical protein